MRKEYPKYPEEEIGKLTPEEQKEIEEHELNSEESERLFKSETFVEEEDIIKKLIDIITLIYKLTNLLYNDLGYQGTQGLNQYDVIKIWELKKDYIIDNKLKGLYSLLPLMQIEPGETDEDIIAKSVKVIETIEDEALRGDSLAAMSIMSSDRYSSTLIQKYVRREMLMNSPLYEEWVSEERKEAAEKATKKARQDTIIELLAEKFDFVPKPLREKISQINDEDIMSELIRKVIKTSSLEEYEDLLDRVLAN